MTIPAKESLQEVQQIHGRANGNLPIGCETAADKRIVAIAERVYRKLFPASNIEITFAPTEQILERLSQASQIRVKNFNCSSPDSLNNLCAAELQPFFQKLFIETIELGRLSPV